MTQRIGRTLAICALSVLATTLIACGTGRVGVREDAVVDSHFHVANYAMQGVPLRTLIERYMGDRVARSTVVPLPLQQKWDPSEHWAQDRIPPNYYLGPKAELYYYSFIDALLAVEFGKLPPALQARLDPMIVGFNPMDRYAPQHIRRALLSFPGVFTGIGEFTVHKEVVSDKIAGEPLAAVSRDPVPEDAGEGGKLSLYSPALEAVLDLAAEAGLVVLLHSDVYPTKITADGTLVSAQPDAPYTAGMVHLCRASPGAKVVWAHTGLGRFVKPTARHLEVVSAVLDACPAWSVDLSWDLVQTCIVKPDPGMPTLAEWAAFVAKYADRVLWGSDTVIYTRNKVDGSGGVTVGGPMAQADYLAVLDVTRPLWDAVGPEVARKVLRGNHERLFDAARAKVRAWEAAHAGDDVWNLPAR